jgi:excisionase family DNA binding protein
MSSTVQTSPAFLKPSEVAKLLRCSRPTVYARIAAGSIPSVRLDEHAPLLVPRRELENRLFGREKQ